MIKLGTVFSGIGAIEQALIRMGIDHEIEFACDNGDIEIDVDYDKELKKTAKELKLSNMDIGLKPATGEVDSESHIPSTITDEGTSEGYYSTVYVKAGGDFKVFVKNIKIESKHDELLVKDERKNIFIAIKDIEKSAKSIEENQVELASFSNPKETEKLTFFIWLSSFASDELEGAKISFDIEFVLA